MTGKMLSDNRELMWMRIQAARALPDNCTVQEEVRTPDGTGKWTSNWQTVATMECRLDPVKGRMQQPESIGDREGLVSLFLLSVAHNVTALAVNRRVLHNGKTYEIRQLVDDQSWAVVRQAYVARLD